jgi:hypothetical protein
VPQKLQPLNQFPARDELEQFASQAAPEREAEAITAVDSWVLGGGASEDQGQPAQARDQKPWQQALVRACEASPLRTSFALNCVAQEAGLFLLAQHGLPDTALRRFMAARCGVYAASIELSSTTSAEVPAQVASASLAEEWGRHFRQYLTEAGGRLSSSDRVGLWAIRQKNRVTLVSARARIEVELAPVVVDDRGNAELTGTLTTPSNPEAIYALVNRGTRSFERCRVLHDLALPRFSFNCRLDGEDKQAWVELVAQPQERLLGHTLARVLVHRGALAPTYVALNLDHRANAATAREFTQQAFALLNRARSEAALTPLSLAEQQSETNAKVAAHLIDAGSAGDGGAADRIALGLLAGWDVVGVEIRDASVISDALRGVHDAATWLRDMLDSPLGRSVLLEPDARELALGAVFDHPWRGVSVVVTAYALFEHADDLADADFVFDAIRSRRLALGLRAPRRLDGMLLVKQADLIRTRSMHPETALHEAMDAMSGVHRVPLRAGYVMANHLEVVDLPDELVRPGRLDLAVAVSHIKLPTAAWGQYVILFVMTDNARRPPL